jgi:glycosyltransferase involved in cell wall biosynthesis
LAYEINNEEYWKSNFDVIRKEILSLSGIITDSFFIKERIYEIFGFRNPIKVIPYGCQTQVFSPASNCQDSAETNILIARKWEPIYNNGLILEALSGMQPQFEFKLRIANGGSLLEDAKQKYQNLTEVGLFTFLGELNPVQLANELAQADVYISAARNDGISVTLLEAMSSGCISIAADFPSVFEVIQDGQNGFLFRHGDLGSLRGTIEKVFGLSEIERENIRQKARKTILASFDWEKNKESFVAFVRELIGG